MAGFLERESPPSDSVTKLLDRRKAAITERSYDAVIEDLSSPDLIGGESCCPTGEFSEEFAFP
jgi:hypothetical protein